MTDQPPNELPGITVTGTRLVFTAGPGGGTPGDPSHNPEEQNEVGEGNEGPSGPTQEEVDAENERQKQCAAQKFATELGQKSERNSKEFFSFTWTENGQTLTHDIRGGAGATISAADRNAARNEFGIAFPDVLGFNHNHPNNVYCGSGGLQGQDELYENQFPSEPDWNWATTAVDEFHVPASTFTLFVTDCEGVTRAFPYSEKDAFKDAVERKLPPPPPINPDCPEA